MESKTGKQLLIPTAAKYWESKKSQFPRLSRVAQFVFATAASTSSIERKFGDIERDLSKERCRIRCDTLQLLTQSDEKGRKFIGRLKYIDGM